MNIKEYKIVTLTPQDVKKLIVEHLRRNCLEVENEFDLDFKPININTSFDTDLLSSDIKCKKCGGIVNESREHIGGDEKGDGGYYQDVHTCLKCGKREVYPD